LEKRIQKRAFFRLNVKPELVAASVLILLGLFFLNDSWQKQLTGTGVYPEVIEKQEELTAFIKDNILEWDKFETPEAKSLISETYKQLDRLERDYNKLYKDFQKTGNRFVLDAMIENAKQRKQILEELKQKLIQIEKMKRYEKDKHNI
jgi:uncharacterized membrane-anchored protein YhcB (DUF1043 family)